MKLYCHGCKRLCADIAKGEVLRKIIVLCPKCQEDEHKRNVMAELEKIFGGGISWS